MRVHYIRKMKRSCQVLLILLLVTGCPALARADGLKAAETVWAMGEMVLWCIAGFVLFLAIMRFLINLGTKKPE